MENKSNIPLWEKLYEEIYRQCNKPWSKMYKFYGAHGIRCLFKDAGDLKKLFDRYNAQAMEEPILLRRYPTRNFSPRNCYFLEMQDYYNNVIFKSSEKYADESEERERKELGRINNRNKDAQKRIEEKIKCHELMWAKQRRAKENTLKLKAKYKAQKVDKFKKIDFSALLKKYLGLYFNVKVCGNCRPDDWLLLRIIECEVKEHRSQSEQEEFNNKLQVLKKVTACLF